MLLTKKKPRGNRQGAQSLVEFAIFAPLLIMFLLIIAEFGFILNYYLNLLDATRETARLFSSFTPFEEPPQGQDCSFDGDANCDDETFYQSAASSLIDTLRPIELDPTSDDIVISVLSITDSGAITRFPSGSGEWHWFNNHTSRFTTADIASRLPSGAPASGAIVVEVYYDYHHQLKVPWLDLFLPDPFTLHAYTIMPLSAAEPTPTPLP
jgi:hypothetical protein